MKSVVLPFSGAAFWIRQKAGLLCRAVLTLWHPDKCQNHLLNQCVTPS